MVVHQGFIEERGLEIRDQLRWVGNSDLVFYERWLKIFEAIHIQPQREFRYKEENLNNRHCLRSIIIWCRGHSGEVLAYDIIGIGSTVSLVFF